MVHSFEAAPPHAGASGPPPRSGGADRARSLTPPFPRGPAEHGAHPRVFEPAGGVVGAPTEPNPAGTVGNIAPSRSAERSRGAAVLTASLAGDGRAACSRTSVTFAGANPDVTRRRACGRSRSRRLCSRAGMTPAEPGAELARLRPAPRRRELGAVVAQGPARPRKGCSRRRGSGWTTRNGRSRPGPTIPVHDLGNRAPESCDPGNKPHPGRRTSAAKLTKKEN